MIFLYMMSEHRKNYICDTIIVQLEEKFPVIEKNKFFQQ